MTRFFCMFFILLMSCSSMAETLHPVVKLERLAQVKAQEQNGDEIRVRVIESYATKSKKKTVATAHLLNWRFLKRNVVKNIWLWQGKLNEGESVDVHFILLEVDRPQGTSDEIGSVMLKLKNVQGKLQEQWVVNEKNTRNVSNNIGEIKIFLMSGSDAVYEMRLRKKLA